MTYPKILLSLALLASAQLRADDWRPLWNGKDLSGWTVWLGKPAPSVVVEGLTKDAKGAYTGPIGARDPMGVFTVGMTDGQPAIHVSGQVFGELRTVESFSNYHLRLEFKWGQKKWPPRDKPTIRRDSGLLYHIHSAPGAEGRTWARSFELQIQEGDVGDLYAVGSLMAVRSTLREGTKPPMYDYDPKGPWHDFSQVTGSEGRCVKQPDNEHPTGEWNTVELVCFGPDSIHIVNGKVVMRLHNPRRIDRPTPELVTSGPILLQSEGSEVFYRNIQIRSITAIPEAFAEK